MRNAINLLDMMGLIAQSRTVQTKQMDFSEFLVQNFCTENLAYICQHFIQCICQTMQSILRSHHLQRHNFRFQAVRHPAKSDLRMGLRYKNIAMKMGHILRLHTEHFPCLSIHILRFMVGSLRNSRHRHRLIVFIGRICGCFFRQILPAALCRHRTSHLTIYCCSCCSCILRLATFHSSSGCLRNLLNSCRIRQLIHCLQGFRCRGNFVFRLPFRR